MTKGILKLICRRDDSMHSLYFGIYDRQRSDCQMTDDGHTVIPKTGKVKVLESTLLGDIRETFTFFTSTPDQANRVGVTPRQRVV